MIINQLRAFLRSACLPGLLHFVCAAILASGLLSLQAEAAVITNTASASFTGVAGAVTINSNTTSLNGLPAATPGVVTFYQYAPLAAGSVSIPFDGGSFDNGGGGSFQPVPSPVALDGSVISLAAPVPVTPTHVYHVNEPVFITLADADRNTDSSVREFITVTVTTSLGDTEILRLQETGPATGIFAGVIQGKGPNVAMGSHDGNLSVNTNVTITVNYQDPYYPTDVSTTAALVDPFGFVFDSATGAPLDGAVVTIVDAATGIPAIVFGDDGVSSFSAQITTGSTVTDTSGKIYNLPTGGFRFPYVKPGNYRFVVTPPTGYTTPSTVPVGSMPNNPLGKPYAVVAGSFSDVFVVVPGPALNIDIPADPSGGGLLLQKTVSQTEASAGDFLQYRLTLANSSATAASNTTVVDRLPLGMRYRSGSLHVNGVKIADPAQSSDGRTLTFDIGTLAAGKSVQINYVVILGASVVPGTAVNTANASANAGALVANQAQVGVTIRDPLFSGRFTIIGRVFDGDCSTPWEQLKGVPNVRVMMEDGTYVITDKDGQYHFEAVRPGTHVVQMDLDSLPAGVEPVSCIDNTRFAGRSFSQFVDVKGGGLWRADFHTRMRRADVGIRMESKLELKTVELPAAVAPMPSLIETPTRNVKNYTLHAEFDSCSASLKPDSAADIQRLIKDLSTEDIKRIELVGHTDSQRLSLRCQKTYKDNYALSEARARSVGEALGAGLDLQPEQITSSGRGPDVPVASNTSPANMARNRRTELRVFLNDAAPVTALEQVQDKAVAASTATVKTVMQVDSITQRIEVDGSTSVNNLKVMAMLPDNTHYVAGSTRVDGVAAADPALAETVATFSLPPEAAAGWHHVIEFSVRPNVVKAVPAPTTPPSRYTVRAQFESCSTDFSAEGRNVVAKLVEQLRDKQLERIELIGHTDSQRLSPRCQKRFADNYALSKARAQALGDALSAALKLKPEQIIASGRGGDVPVADNSTAAGRDSNRRVEVIVHEDGAAAAAPAAAPEAAVPGKRKELFDSCSTELQPEARAAIAKLVTDLQGRKIDWVELVGHTDNQRLSPRCLAIFKDNYALSRARAQAMGDVLAQGLGLKPSQITAIGRGSDEPVADNATAEGRAANRRTEIILHQNSDKDSNDNVLLLSGGRGPDVPVADNKSATGMASNRRADLVVYGREGSEAAPVSNCPADPYAVKAMASFEPGTQKRAQTPAVQTRVSCPAAAAPVSSSAPAAATAATTTAAPAATADAPAAAAVNTLSDASQRASVNVQSSTAKPLPASLLARQRERNEVEDDITASGAERDWLTGQAPGNAWLFPDAAHNPRAPAVRIVIKHAPDQIVVLKQADGEEVSGLNFDGTQTNTDKTVAVSIWRGVVLNDGQNAFTAEIRDKSGKVVDRITHVVNYSNSPVRAELVPEQSILVADGINRPVLAVRLLDRDGHPVRAGVTGPIEISAPYLPWQRVDDEQKRALAGLDRFQPTYRVEGDKGIAYIELQPTTESGAVQLSLNFQTGNNASRKQDLRAWLEPAARDWVVVGFAEGTVGYQTLHDHSQSLAEQGVEKGTYNDGQISLYAKGRVLGKWLLTMAFDSDKSDQRDRQKSLLGVIDPKQYYTLYGDGTQQRQDAPSQDKLYLKLERGQFYAMFGDYTTGLNQTKLSRYNRTLNGIKTENGEGPVVFTAYAAETPQSYAHDEIQGDGTSGLYRLTQGNIVLNSDMIRIETRDRVQTDKVLESRSLVQHLDYEIDYAAGTIFFKQPVNSRDTNFNPVFIVAEYETLGTADKQLNAGGRVGLRLRNGDVQVGVSEIHDETNLDSTSLTGADARIKVGKDSEVRVEAATSNSQLATQSTDGAAWLAEFEHHNGLFDALLYARRQDPGFGVKQQSPIDNGQQKIGAEGQVRLSPNWSVQGQLYQQQNLSTDTTRDAAMTKLQYATAQGGVSIGAQVVDDSTTMGALAGQDFRSEQATLAGNRWFMNHKLELTAQADNSFGGPSNSVDFPDRYVFGAGYDVTDSARLLIGQEFTDGASLDTSTTRAGVQVVPWKGARLGSTLNQSQISEYGPRTFGQMGLTQAVLLGEKWGLDFSVDTSHTFNRTSGTPLVVNSAAPISSSGTVSSTALTEDFQAYTAGATYRDDLWTWNGRAETRNGETSDRYGVVSNFLRQARAGVAFSTSTQVFRTAQQVGSDGLLGTLDLSWAWRPLGVQWSILDRLEFRYEDVSGGTGVTGSGLFGNTSLTATNASTRRIINNFALNRVSREWTGADRQGNLFRRYERNQWSLYYGAKYAMDTYDGVDYSGYTDIMGVEVRHDLTNWLDLGVQASALNAWTAGNHSYSFGPMVGVSPVTNGWITVGWNVKGFSDRDFDAARYTAQGPYLQLRFKFDQNTRLDFGKHSADTGDTNTRASE